MWRLAALAYRRAQTLNKKSRSNYSSFVFDQGFASGYEWRSPRVALHPSVRITVGVFRFRRTCWRLHWETKCSILLAPNGGFLLNVSWNDPKRARKENKASVLRKDSDTLVCLSAACTCLRGCVCRGPLGPSTSRKEPVNKRACCWGRTCRTCTSTSGTADGVAPVARLGCVKCPSVGAEKDVLFLLGFKGKGKIFRKCPLTFSMKQDCFFTQNNRSGPTAVATLLPS